MNHGFVRMAGATLLADGSTLLLCRVEDRRGLSHLCAARSRNGEDGWQIDSEPTLMPSPNDYPEEIWGIEDPRITFVPELQQYVVTYTSYSRGGPGGSREGATVTPPGSFEASRRDARY